MYRLFSLSWLAACATPALAQPSNIALSFDFSTDNGATWTASSLQVDNTQPINIRVRGVVSWVNGATDYGLGSLQLDPFVTGVGDQDSIQQPVFRDGTQLVDRGGVPTRIDSILKIDLAGDLSLPGFGPSWITAGQNPGFPEFDFANSLPILSFDLTLDGSVGTRTVSSIIRGTGQGSVSMFWSPTQGAFFPIVVTPADVTVVPAPAPLAALLLGGIFATRRRRN